MPSFRELIDEVDTLLDFNPDLASHRDQVGRVINRHYLEIGGQYSWLFLQKDVAFNVYKQVSGSAGVTVTILGPELRAVSGAGTAFTSAMEGQTIVIGTSEHTIAAVVSATSLYIDPASTGPVAPTINWSVQFRRYALPANCSQPLGFMDRADNRGRLVFIDRRKEESLFLDRDDTGDSFTIIEDDHQNDRAPEPGLVATVSGAGANSLSANTTYQYCYTYENEGRESPPSQIVEATTTGANRTISLNGIENMNIGAISTGRLKNVYRRDVTNSGRWLRRTSNLAEITTTLVDDGVPAPSFDDALVLFNQEPRQYVRAWYTAGDDRELRLRYLVKTRRLQADNDTPLWPETYHHLLVYRTMQDVCAQHGMDGQATMWERRGNDVLRRMRDKWLARQDRTIVRQGFDAAGGRDGHFGDPTKV